MASKDQHPFPWQLAKRVRHLTDAAWRPLMSRSLPLCLLIFSPFAVAQNFVPSPAMPTQVVYTVGSSTITTYNVDRQTLNATQVGSPLTLNTATLDYSIFSVTPSAHDRTLYVIVPASSSTSEQLRIYATDISGVPQNPPVQVIQTTGLDQVLMDPKTSFLYATFQLSNGNYTFFNIRRYQVDAEGKLHNPEKVASYKLPNGGTDFCYVSLLGFNAAGTELYDEVGCSYPDSSAATYNERTVDVQTGALGPDVEVFSWSNGAGGFDYVQFVKDLVFVFEMPNGFQFGLNSESVYPLIPNTTTPLLQCTASMLQSCGYAQVGMPHPSGKYLFMSDSGDFTEIDKVELNAKKLVDTGSYIPNGFNNYIPGAQHFSPDGTLVYANGNNGIEIYGFNAATATVTPGGGITPAANGFFLATQRD